ncbi:MAG: Gfo/Idh/MocA family oxidoreductase [Candidatus Aminicenantales bacterium]
MINLGVIGYGYWGPNVARNFNNCGGVKLVSICDLDERRLKLAKATFPFIKVSSNPKGILNSDDIQAVAIVTPVFTHYELAKAALENGKHIFVEKPFTSNARQAEELINLALTKNLKIMIDHTFLFTGAVRKIREILNSGELGSLFFYDSTRINLGLFQHDINVVWDLAPHDFSIMNYLLDKCPIAISAQGTDHFGAGIEDVAYIAAHFDNGFIGHFHCNWLSPVKIRKTLISGDKKMLVWDDLVSDEKIKIYDRGVEFKNGEGIRKLLVSYRSGDMYAPKVSSTEALQLEAEYFLECIEKNIEPHNNGEAGLRVVRMLEATDRSLKSGGGKIKI